MNNDKVSVINGIGVLLSILLGSGVIIVPAVAVSIVDGLAVVAWFILAVLFIPVVLLFSSLGKRYADNSGTAYYMKNAFGKGASKSIGILYVSIAPIGPPVVLIAGAAFLAELTGISSTYLLYIELILLACILVTNLVNITFTARLQTVFSIFMVVSILSFSILVIKDLGLSTLPPMHTLSVTNMGQAMAVMFWAFIGIEAISHIANDLKNPRRDFPIVVIVGTLLSVIVYIIVTYTIWRLGTYGSQSENLLSVTGIGQYVFGEWGAKVISLAGFIGCFSTANLYILSFGRMLESVCNNSEDDSLSSRKRHQMTYVLPIILSIALVLIIRHTLSISFSTLIEYANGVFVMIYLAAAVCGVVLFQGVKRMQALLATLVCLLMGFFIGIPIVYSFIIFFISILWFYRERLSKMGNSVRQRYRTG